MDFTGTYKLIEIQDMEMTDNGLKFDWVTADTYLEKHKDDREAVGIAKSLLSVKENGTYTTLFPIPEGTPEEEINKAIEQGATIIDNKYIELDESSNALWEMRGDDFYTKSGVEGEVLGEKTDPWIKSNQEDGTIILGNFAKMKFEKLS